MRRLLLFVLIIACYSGVSAQQNSITFTSLSDARYYFYINGELQNDKAVSTITFNNLEAKDYLFRIVVDDPYEVAVIKTLRPSTTKNRYTLLFNPVKERIILETEKAERNNPSNTIGNSRSSNYGNTTERMSRTERKTQRQADREDAQERSATSTGKTVHKVKSPVFED